MLNKAIVEGLRFIFQGIERLKQGFPNREFTIDGRLVGDIGEVIAALEYDVILDEVARPIHDGKTSDGRNVQIKANFKDQLTFKTTPDYYLGFKLHPNGSYEEIFNGPGCIISKKYEHRKGIGVVLLSFPISDLRQLSGKADPSARIPKRGS